MEMEPRLLDDIIRRLMVLNVQRPGRRVDLKESEIRQLCCKARKIFLDEPTLLEIQVPINIAGDIHGHYHDLHTLFEKGGGYPPNSRYLFLGDYVDRGKQSLETICLLLAYKIKYPDMVFLLRGNHECANINKIYGFYHDCKSRYNVSLWKTFTDCFNCLPIAALVETKILCMHGGLSPELTSLDQIRSIQRPIEVQNSGLLCDLLWSDPDHKAKGWDVNSRGVSYTFGPEIVTQIIKAFDIDLICRGHQVVEHGYEFFANQQLVTIFSASNYSSDFYNIGAFLSVDERLMCKIIDLKPER